MQGGLGPTPDPGETPARDTLVWCRPDQVALVRAVRERAGLTIVRAGSPEAGKSGLVAGELATDGADDLRASLATTDADLVLIADPGAFGAGGADEDVSAIAAARSRGARVVSLDPIPADALDLSGSAWAEEGRAVDAVRLVNAPRRTRVCRELIGVRESFGAVRAISVEVATPPAAGSLGSALVGAIDLVLMLLGEPETVDASLVGSASTGGGRAGQSVRALHGEMLAMMRLPGGQAASVVASDRVAAWALRMTILGEGGVIRLDPRGFEWAGADGELVDDHRVEQRAEDDDTTDAGAVIADQISRLLDPASPEDAPIDLPGALAVAHAALLSARTGQPESPLAMQKVVAR